MPTTAPMTKVAACRALGATIEQIGTTLEEATDRAHELAAEQGLTFISPYDDWDIIAGQASCGLEMLEDFEDMTTAVVPRSEEHTSELQSRGHIACRLLLGT